jgi:serine-type D-Ala-D-Ala carboxypeptidase (penicillin-binding protein 5/6)
VIKGGHDHRFFRRKFVTECQKLHGSEGISGVRLSISQRLAVVASLVLGLLVQPVLIAGVLADESDESPLAARNAIVVSADSGQVLFDKGMNEHVPPASLTKIFTAIVALETAPTEREMVVDEYDLVGEASIGLIPEETVTVKTLLHGLMLTSGNDAAMTIARELGHLPGDTPQESVARFVDRINGTAQRLGLSDTNLRNPHGLDQDDHYSSASDIAAVTMYALDNPVFRQLISTPYYGFNGREFYNVNEFLDVYPGLVGGKTGITTKAGHSLMQVAERDGNTIVVVLLGSTRDAWYADAEYLMNLGFDELARNPEDESRPVIGRSAFSVPELAHSQSVGGNLTVDRVNDHEAIIRPSTPISPEESTSWRWLLVSVGMMGVALVMVLNYPVIVGIGALAINRGSRIRLTMPSTPSLMTARDLFRRPANVRLRGHEVGWQPNAYSDSAPVDRLRTGPRFTRGRNHRLGDRGDESMDSATQQPAVSVSPARTRAESAIKLAMQGRYHIATEEFRLAFDRDPEVDITKCPGFWRMQPMGYIAAAKAYAINGQQDEARRLLTVVQLAFKQNSNLVGLFGRAIKELERR